jgi:putative Mn2+ efflux pump MntP
MKDTAYTDKTKRRLFLDNFVAGIGWGIGSVVGAVTLFLVVGFLITRVQAIPIVGGFVYNVLVEVEALRGR